MRLRSALIILFFTFSYLILYYIGSARPAFSLYNDDLGWLAVTAGRHTHSWKDIFLFTWTRHSEVGAPVLNLFLGVYFRLFGNTSAYLLPLTLLAYVTGGLFFLCFLNELFPKQRSKNFAVTALYVLGFPHFHAYLWAISFQHLYFILTHFAALTFCLRTIKDPERFSKKYFLLFGFVFILGSLGRTTFWFTWASVIWLLLTSSIPFRASLLKRFAPLLALTLLYPFLESYDGTWGSQVERLAQSFWWSFGILKVYRAIPLGWLLCWLAFFPIFYRLLPQVTQYLPNERRIKIGLVGIFALLLVIHGFFYKEDLFYILISYVKYLWPSLHENSPVGLLRWQPIVLATTYSGEWLMLLLCCGLAPLLAWTTFNRLGIRSAVFFLPVIPSLFYSRTMGGGGYLLVDSEVHYFLISRYLLYMAPWVLVSLSALISEDKETQRRLAIPFIALVVWHMNTLHFRLEKTALSEASTHFSSLFPESLRYALRNLPGKFTISTQGIEAMTFDDRFSEKWKLAEQLPMDLFLWHLNRENPGKFSYASENADYRFCKTTWCDRNGQRIDNDPARRPLVEVISLRKGQTAEAYLKNVSAHSWEEWINTCWKLKEFTHRTKQLLLDEVRELQERNN